MLARPILSLLAACCLAAPAFAEAEISLYLGAQTSPHSRITGENPDGGSFDELIGWEGKSFSPPVYYGLRGVWWQNEKLGYGIEVTHAKVYAPESERAAAGFDRLEFSDGLNILTVNAYRRWLDQWGELTPYVGAGLGIAVPHVDVTSAGGERTYGYQLTGPAARLTAGASYDLSERFAVFGEYQFTYSSNEADLEGGGTLSTDVITNAVNVGVTLKF